jgi:hypothetical protein
MVHMRPPAAFSARLGTPRPAGGAALLPAGRHVGTERRKLRGMRRRAESKGHVRVHITRGSGGLSAQVGCRCLQLPRPAQARIPPRVSVIPARASGAAGGPLHPPPLRTPAGAQLKHLQLRAAPSTTRTCRLWYAASLAALRAWYSCASSGTCPFAFACTSRIQRSTRHQSLKVHPFAARGARGTGAHCPGGGRCCV